MGCGELGMGLEWNGGREVLDGLVDIELRMRMEYNCCSVWLMHRR